MLQNCPKFQRQNAFLCGHVIHDTSGQNHGQTLETLRYLLKSTGQPEAESPEVENMKFSNYPLVEKIFQRINSTARYS